MMTDGNWRLGLIVDDACEGQEPTRLVGVFHPSNSTLTIAKPARSRISAFGMEFENAGRSVFSAPFTWNG
jgi:hypothetical protein